MKKKIVIGFIVLTTIFTAGGLYISVSIDQVISKLETIITLHQVEILRKTLLTDVKAVQQDFLLKDSPHAEDIDSIVQHGEKMAEAVEGCFDCHHAESSRRTIGELAGRHPALPDGSEQGLHDQGEPREDEQTKADRLPHRAADHPRNQCDHRILVGDASPKNRNRHG